MASIHAYRTAKGERRYDVRYRDARAAALACVLCRRRAGVQARHRAPAPGRHALPGAAEPSPLRTRGSSATRSAPPAASGRGRGRSRLRGHPAQLAPLAELQSNGSIGRCRGSDRGDRRRQAAPAEMALALLKRILKWAKSADSRSTRRSTASGSRGPRARAAVPDLGGGRGASLVDARVHPRIVPIAVLTMLRRGEILGLRDRDIDFEAGSIAVFSQRQDGGRVRRRRVPGGAPSTSDRRAQAAARAAARPRPEPSTACCSPRAPARRGTRITSTPRLQARGLPRGIPALTFHDLRHTGASLMIAAGCHVKVIAEQMGHADGGALVLRRYGHLYKGARRQAALALEEHVLNPSRDTGRAVADLGSGSRSSGPSSLTVRSRRAAAGGTRRARRGVA